MSCFVEPTDLSARPDTRERARASMAGFRFAGSHHNSEATAAGEDHPSPGPAPRDSLSPQRGEGRDEGCDNLRRSSGTASAVFDQGETRRWFMKSPLVLADALTGRESGARASCPLCALARPPRAGIAQSGRGRPRSEFRLVGNALVLADLLTGHDPDWHADFSPQDRGDVGRHRNLQARGSVRGPCGLKSACRLPRELAGRIVPARGHLARFAL